MMMRVQKQVMPESVDYKILTGSFTSVASAKTKVTCTYANLPRDNSNRQHPKVWTMGKNPHHASGQDSCITWDTNQNSTTTKMLQVTKSLQSELSQLSSLDRSLKKVQKYKLRAFISKPQISVHSNTQTTQLPPNHAQPNIQPNTLRCHNQTPRQAVAGIHNSRYMVLSSTGRSDAGGARPFLGHQPARQPHRHTSASVSEQTIGPPIMNTCSLTPLSSPSSFQGCCGKGKLSQIFASLLHGGCH